MSTNNGGGGAVPENDPYLETIVFGRPYVHVTVAARMMDISPSAIVVDGKRATELAQRLGATKLLVNGHTRAYCPKDKVEAEMRRRDAEARVRAREERQAQAKARAERRVVSPPVVEAVVVGTEDIVTGCELRTFMAEMNERLHAIENALTAPTTTASPLPAPASFLMRGDLPEQRQQ